MLSQVHIRNFQSVKSVDVELGKLTVILGPSSTGKSATLRALRTLFRNTSGTSAVSHGAKALSVEAMMDDEATIIAIERGKSNSTYRLIEDLGAGDSHEDVYPKSGVKVPEDVASVVKMPLVEGKDINFGFQFDSPFLLSEPASMAAKVLGDLSNVTLLQEAAQEANRRRLRAEGEIRTRKGDLADARERMQQFKDLPDAVKAARSLRDELESVRATADEAAGLGRCLEDLGILAKALREAKAAEARGNPYGAVPEAYEALRDAQALEILIRGASSAEAGAEAQRLAELDARALADSCTVAHDAALKKNGFCPTCGQSV